MIDPTQRKLTYLRLSITEFCNFSCNYCLPDGFVGKRSRSELSLEEISNLVSGFAAMGIKKVRLTGGEPTVRADLPEIIKRCKAVPGINKVALTTNGYKLAKHLEDWRAAGLDQINLSIDTFNADEFAAITGMNLLPQIMADLDTALDMGAFSIKLNATLNDSTWRTVLCDALEIVRTKPLTFRFIELMQTTHNTDLFFAEHARSEALKDQLVQAGWQSTARRETDGPAIEYTHPDFAGRIGIIAPYAPGFCESCNRLRVSSEGKLHLCLFDSANFDLRPLLQSDCADELRARIGELIQVKPAEHHLKTGNSGLMHNLSLIGG